MCASFGFDLDNDGITSWEDNMLFPKFTEDIRVSRPDNVIYDSCFDDIYLGDERREAV